MKVLDAHFGRIMQLESLTIGSWNSVITSSIDRSVKIWNINNIFEQVHVIDRHELQIDNIRFVSQLFLLILNVLNLKSIDLRVCVFFVWFSLSQTDLAATVTRGCVGVWEIRSGRILSKLADSHLGAIVTHAEITADGKYIVSSETGKLLIWNRVSEQVLFRDDQPGIQQIKFLENCEKVLSISCKKINRKDAGINNSEENTPLIALAKVRTICGTHIFNFNILKSIIVVSYVDGIVQFTFEFPFRIIPGIAFRNAVVTADGIHIVVVSVDKSGKDCINVFSATSGNHLHKVSLRGSNIKVYNKYFINYCVLMFFSFFFHRM